MSEIHSQSFDQTQDSGNLNDDDFKNDDLITFQHESKTINFHYSQLTKYSKHIRDKYLLPVNDYLFFQLLQRNYNIINDSS